MVQMKVAEQYSILRSSHRVTVFLSFLCVRFLEQLGAWLRNWIFPIAEVVILEKVSMMGADQVQGCLLSHSPF